MKTTSGFTAVELLISIVLLGIVGTAFFQIFQSIQMTHRDQDRKSAINAMHHNLQEVVRPKLGGYPRVLSASQLSALDKNILADPSGTSIGTPYSDYRYEPTGCNGGEVCEGYALRADLEREKDFIKASTRY